MFINTTTSPTPTPTPTPMRHDRPQLYTSHTYPKIGLGKRPKWRVLDIICLLVNLVHSASPADWKLSSIGVVYYRSGMKCAVLVRTSQNLPFFIKSMFLPHWYYLIIVHLWLSFQDSDSTYLEIINKLVERLSLQPLNHFCVWSFPNEPYIFTRR